MFLSAVGLRRKNRLLKACQDYLLATFTDIFNNILLTTNLACVLLTGAGAAKDTLDDLLGDLLEDGRWLG